MAPPAEALTQYAAMCWCTRCNAALQSKGSRCRAGAHVNRHASLQRARGCHAVAPRHYTGLIETELFMGFETETSVLRRAGHGGRRRRRRIVIVDQMREPAWVFKFKAENKGRQQCPPRQHKSLPRPAPLRRRRRQCINASVCCSCCPSLPPPRIIQQRTLRHVETRAHGELQS